MKKLLTLLLALCACMAFMIPAMAEASGIYVLMNIPYADFYANEADVVPPDAVTSATRMKPRAGALAGGSYHVDPEGGDISGVIYPVYVEDASMLTELGGVEITDESRVEITVTLKGQDQTTVYEGRDALFEAPSYSWYALSEAPTLYKTLEMGDTPTFSAVNGEPVEINASASIIYDKHADIVVRVDGLEDALGDAPVSGIVLVADDGTRVGLRHLANFWRRMEIGMRLDDDVYAALKGRRVDAIEYITTNGLYVVDTDLPIVEDAQLIALAGTYIELFPEFAKAEFKDWWMECIKAYVADDAATEEYYTALTQTYMSTLRGQEAIDAYGDDPEGIRFNCGFTDGLKKLTVSGNIISGVDANGDALFSHTYSYLQELPVSFFGQDIGSALRVYQSDDADSGVFTYFAFADDDLNATQHIEFRYGANLEDLGNYSEGEYAYWVASATLDGYKESLLKDCIKLFVDENLGEQGELAEVIEIATAEALAAINDNLSGHYILTADINLSTYENWTPIGTYAPSGESEEEQEIPAADTAFTGTFDGQGHVISNLTINQPEGWALGLFGCAANAEIGNFTLENASVDAALMSADVVGYAYCTTVSGVTLVNGKVTAHFGEMSEEGMFGGIVGAGMGSMIENCTAQAYITLPDGMANAGIVGGGLEMTSLVNCAATGTITAGNDCYGLGGISGCGFGAEQFTDCVAEGVTIAAGDNCFWIGGITSYAGGYPDASFGMPVTVFTRCIARNVTVTTGENADGIGDIVGSGFYNEAVAEANGAPFDQPTEFELVDCAVENDAEVIEIDTAEALAAINDNLTGHYILTADIDLSAYENWIPIGAFQPLSDAPEDAEIPHPDYAFAGRFDGNGHTISNLTITSAPMMGAGLFGCASGSERGEAYIGNFTLENVNVIGGYLVGGAVGLQFMNCKVSDITLTGENRLTGMQGIGGIVGTGFDWISNCSATADITALGDDGACAGLIAGGTTMSSIENCRAIGGSITAEGNATWAFGAICGAPWGAPEIRDCTARDTVIRVTGEGNRLVGGLLGFAGTYDPENPARIVGCKVENVTIEVSDTTDSVGGLVGAGKEMMAGSDVMSAFEISDCAVSGTIIGGEYVDAIVGDPACAVAIDCEGGMRVE